MAGKFRKITTEDRKLKARVDNARTEMYAALAEHECFLESERADRCWICAKPFFNGGFPSSAVAVPVRAVVVQTSKPSGRPKPAAPAKECLCPMDQDGECLPCKGIMSSSIGLMTDLAARTIHDFKELLKSFQKPGCGGCGRRYVDYGIAKAFKGVFGPLGSQAVAFEIFKALMKAMEGMGITDVPLVRKAWADLCAENAWDQWLSQD